MALSQDRQLYERLYTTTDYGRQLASGHKSHGHPYLLTLLSHNPKNAIDVGCSYNRFARTMRREGVPTCGIDFACPAADMYADIINLPFRSKAFDFITAWDVLEHFHESQLDQVLREMSRVSNRYAFTISYLPSKRDKNLHLTVWDPFQWLKLLQRHSVLDFKKGKFWMGRWT